MEHIQTEMQLRGGGGYEGSAHIRQTSESLADGLLPTHLRGRVRGEKKNHKALITMQQSFDQFTVQ